MPRRARRRSATWRWVEWQSAFDPLFPKGTRAYWRNTSFDRLDEDVIDVLAGRGSEQTWSGTGFDVHNMAGAFGRVPEEATPFPNRAARFWLNIYGFWTDPADDDDRIAFVRGMSADMEPFATGATTSISKATSLPGTAGSTSARCSVRRSTSDSSR